MFIGCQDGRQSLLAELFLEVFLDLTLNINWQSVDELADLRLEQDNLRHDVPNFRCSVINVNSSHDKLDLDGGYSLVESVSKALRALSAEVVIASLVTREVAVSLTVDPRFAHVAV